jgi:hypothetical protein
LAPDLGPLRRQATESAKRAGRQNTFNKYHPIRIIGFL